MKGLRHVPPIAVLPMFVYSTAVHRLTRQEQMVLCVVFALLLIGWAVKSYRTAHPKPPASEALKL